MAVNIGVFGMDDQMNGNGMHGMGVHGAGLSVAGQAGGRFSLKKALKKTGNVIDKANKIASNPLVEAATAELAPELLPALGAVQEAAKVKAVVNQAGKGYGKGTQRKALAAIKKGAKIGDALISQYGNEKQKKQAAKAKAVANVIRASQTGGAPPSRASLRVAAMKNRHQL